jgi:hypothetical protein
MATKSLEPKKEINFAGIYSNCRKIVGGDSSPKAGVK